MHRWTLKQKGFTIVELLIVIVVIGILAAITIVSFNGVTAKANVSAIKSSVEQATKKIAIYATVNGTNAAALSDAGVTNSGGLTYAYQTYQGGKSYCVSATQSGVTYSAQDNSAPFLGACGQVFASYYNGMTLTGTPLIEQFENQVNYDWGTGSPIVGIVPTDSFSARWSGYLVPPVTGNYTFYTFTDDQSRLYVNNTLILDEWGTACCTTYTSATVALTAGVTVPFKYEMDEGGGGAIAIISWSYPGQSIIPIPSTGFSRVAWQ